MRRFLAILIGIAGGLFIGVPLVGLTLALLGRLLPETFFTLGTAKIVSLVYVVPFIVFTILGLRWMGINKNVVPPMSSGAPPRSNRGLILNALTIIFVIFVGIALLGRWIVTLLVGL